MKKALKLHKFRGTSWIEIILFIGIFFSLSYFIILRIKTGILEEQRYIYYMSRDYDRIRSSIIILNDINLSKVDVYKKIPFLVYLNGNIYSSCSSCVYINYTNGDLYIVGNRTSKFIGINLRLSYLNVSWENSTVNCRKIEEPNTNLYYSCYIKPDKQSFLVHFQVLGNYIVFTYISGNFKMVIGNESYYIGNIPKSYVTVYKRSRVGIDKLIIS